MQCLGRSSAATAQPDSMEAAAYDHATNATRQPNSRPHSGSGITTATAADTQQLQQQLQQQQQMNTLFFSVLTNASLRGEITKHVLSGRSMFSRAIAARPLHYQRYSQINSAEWIAQNGYFALLLDKIRARKPLVINQKAISIVCARCHDPALFGAIFAAKREYFYDASLLQSACEGGNLAALDTLLATQQWVIGSAALEGAITHGRLAVVELVYASHHALLAPALVPRLFLLALTSRASAIAHFLFERVGFFLAGPMEGMVRALCSLGELSFFTSIYESFQLVLATTSLKEYHQFLIELLDYTALRITRDHMAIIAYIEKSGRVAIPPIPADMSDAALYSLFIRWVYLNKPRVVEHMSNSILKSAVAIGDAELFHFAYTNFANAHLSKYMPAACAAGCLPIVRYLLEHNIEALTNRSLQLAYFAGHFELVGFVRDNLKSIHIDTAYHYRKPLDYARYPVDILRARVNGADAADPVMQMLASDVLFDGETVQAIFVKAFLEGDHPALRFMVEHMTDELTITRSLWQIVAKIGDPELYTAFVGLQQRTQEGRRNEVTVADIATRISVEASIWGQLDLLRHVLAEPGVANDMAAVEYLAQSATFNGNCDIVSYLMDNHKMSKKTLTTLIKHAINYRHYDLVKLYHHHYSIPLDKKLVKNSMALNSNIDGFKRTKKR
eukprot:gene16368-19476_t